MNFPRFVNFKTLFQGLALGMLLVSILTLFGPQGTVATQATMERIQQGLVWPPTKQAAIFGILSTSISFLAILPPFVRKTNADKLFSAIIGTASAGLLIYAVLLL